MAQQITVDDIIKNARNRDAAIADYNSHSASGVKLNYNDFYDKLERKFPIKGGTGGGNTNTNDGGQTSGGQKVAGNIIEFIGKGLLTQEKQEYLPSIKEEMIGVQDIMNTVLDSKGDLKDLSKIGESLIKNLGGELEKYYNQQTALIDRINRQAGLTGDLAKNFREELTNANPRLLQLGIGFDDLAQSVKIAFEASGRFNLLNQQTLERAGEIALAYVGDLDQLVRMYGEFEKVGLGASDAQEKIADAGKEAIGLGLRSQNVTNELNKNIGKLNEYGFKKGVDGLSEMVRKATEFRISMDSVFTIADKVMNPDGAIELAANLQVLGGAIGDFNDPLKLMYMATNNVEGLQDALIGAASSLTTYNSEQGRFEITGVNLRRAKEMAAQLGISYQELAKGAVAAAERTSASADLMARGLKLDKKQEEFITNLAQMKDGKMVIEVGSSKDLKEYFKGQSTVKLEELTQDQVEQLIKYQDTLKTMTAEEVVKQQASDIENMKRDVNYIAALLRIQAGRITNDAMLMGLSATTGQTLKQLETSFAEFSKNQTGPIQSIQDNFIKLVGSEVKKAEDFRNNKDKKSATEDKKNESKQTSPVVNVNPKENTTKEDPNKGKVILDEAGIVIASEIAKKIDENKSKTINPTQPTQTNPNLKTNEQKDENNKFLSDFERGLSSLNKQQPQPLKFDINRENPLTVNITEESIVKLKKSEVNPSLGQLDKQNFNFSEDFYSDFEKTYGSINKDNQKSLTFDINRDKPLDVNITEESITKLVKNDIKPLLNEQKNVSTDSPNNFLSGFEKTYGSINKGNEKSVVKVSPQSIETQKNNDLQKAISEQNQKNSLVRNTDQQKPNTEENESVATVVHKHIVEMNVSSTGPIVDVLARAMLKDPTIVSQFIGRDVREFV